MDFCTAGKVLLVRWLVVAASRYRYKTIRRVDVDQEQNRNMPSEHINNRLSAPTHRSSIIKMWNFNKVHKSVGGFSFSN